MTSKNAKAAQQWDAGGLRKYDQLAGSIYSEDTKPEIELQARRLTRRFAVSIPLALAIAGLAYDCGVRR
ncbi:MAG: hypothetical protein J0H51_18695 [Rhizobiales bacterium]|nr:hypothetical protein [Hyphomicrobiales bacterium]